MNENKGKVKEFVKEYKGEILLGTGLAVLGIGIGWNANTLYDYFKGRVIVTHDGIKNTLCDAATKFKSKNWICNYISDVPLKPEDLGKFGKKIMELSTDGEKPEFTHFIAIGPNNN